MSDPIEEGQVRAYLEILSWMGKDPPREEMTAKELRSITENEVRSLLFVLSTSAALVEAWRDGDMNTVSEAVSMLMEPYLRRMRSGAEEEARARAEQNAHRRAICPGVKELEDIIQAHVRVEGTTDEDGEGMWVAYTQHLRLGPIGELRVHGGSASEALTKLRYLVTMELRLLADELGCMTEGGQCPTAALQEDS